MLLQKAFVVTFFLVNLQNVGSVDPMTVNKKGGGEGHRLSRQSSLL